MNRFARVTTLEGRVQWINLDHVRQVVEEKPRPGYPVVTAIHIDSSWVERVILVSERPEEIIGGADPA